MSQRYGSSDRAALANALQTRFQPQRHIWNTVRSFCNCKLAFQGRNAAAHPAQLADCFDTAQLQEAVMNVNVLLIHLVSCLSQIQGS